MGVDLGTSSVKTVIIDREGRLLSVAAQEYDIETPTPGWAEQDPETWVRAALETMRRALQESGVDSAEIQAIGLSGQMHGLVCAGEHGRHLRPAIIWADQRSKRQVEQVVHRVGRQRLGEWTANPIAAGFMLASWLWILENEPDTARATAFLFLPKDYVRFRLTGETGAEPSDASSTLMFDVAGRTWSRPLLEQFNISPDLLPSLRASTDVAGGLSEEAAGLSGLRSGTPVVYGGADQPVQALGHGLIDPGWLSCTIGTGGQLFAPTQSPTYDQGLRLHSFCHILPDRWYLMAATLSAGLSFKWLRDNIFKRTSYQELADLAAQTQDSEGLFFLPHLAGERTPYMDPDSKACFWGLTLRHHSGHIVRAVMEGVVFSLREGFDLILGLGVPVERVIASGGGTNHLLWLQLMADVFDRPIYQTGSIEAAGRGAAMLAGIGTGVYADANAACQSTVRWSEEIMLPDPARRDTFKERYNLFRQLYPALQGISSFQKK
jgi:xylulokinase